VPWRKYSNSVRSGRPACIGCVGAARSSARTLRGQPIGLADIVTLGLELGVARSVDPAAGAVGLEVYLAQETPHRVRREALYDATFGCCRERRLRPMGEWSDALARRLTGQGDDRADLLGLECRWCSQARCIRQVIGERLPHTGARCPQVGGGVSW
jgi:hypothetical protein